MELLRLLKGSTNASLNFCERPYQGLNRCLTLKSMRSKCTSFSVVCSVLTGSNLVVVVGILFSDARLFGKLPAIKQMGVSEMA